MEKITLNTLEEFRAFCESEKAKEKAFLKDNENCYFRAYKYYENHCNTCDYNILDSLIDDIEFLSFPLEIEIIENPITVEQIGIFAEFFEDPRKAFDYAKKLFNEDGVRGIEIIGKGLIYDYDRGLDFSGLSPNEKSIREMLSMIER